MECLETGKVCSNTNMKCKDCVLDECKGALIMLEIQERKIREKKLDRLKKHLPNSCKQCSQLEIIDLDKEKVKCFYMIKEKCILK